MSDGLYALVLAAGSGRRFGGGKLLARYRGRPLIEHALAAAFAAPVEAVVLITGADAAVAPVAQAWSAGRALRIVHAADHAEGLAASLRAGAAALPGDAAGAFVFLADMPRTPNEITAALARAVREGAPAAAPSCQGRRGHPVLLGRTALQQVSRLRGDSGAREMLDRFGDRLALVPTSDDGVLFDVDRPEHLTEDSAS